jgi:hypothetical protein
VTEGYAAACRALRRALEAVLALEVASDIGRWSWLTGSRAGADRRLELWDADAWHALAERQVRVARDMGALVRLQFALHFARPEPPARRRPRRGGRAIEEERAIAEATGTSPVAYTEMTLAAWRGQEALTSELIERERREATARGIGRMAHFATYSAGGALQRHRPLRRGTRRGRGARSSTTPGLHPFVVPEVAEAASRTGDTALLQATVEWMAERTS